MARRKRRPIEGRPQILTSDDVSRIHRALSASFPGSRLIAIDDDKKVVRTKAGAVLTRFFRARPLEDLWYISKAPMMLALPLDKRLHAAPLSAVAVPVQPVSAP